MWRRWPQRLRYWFERDDRERRLREEMQFHLELTREDLMENGMTEPEARAAAQRQFGNMTRQQEDAGSMWIARWLQDLLQDGALAMRNIRRQPSFTALAVLSTALGIGACSLLFGLANFALFRPLPVEEPARLLSISGQSMRRGKTGMSITYPDFEDLRQARSLQGVAAVSSFVPASIAAGATGGEPRRYWGALVTANFFEVVRPAFTAGRGFAADRDDRPGSAPVVVLSHRLWRSRFGGDGKIIGRSIEMNRLQMTVVGVTGPGFQGSEAMFISDFWLPFSLLGRMGEAGPAERRLTDRTSQWLTVAARVREGMSQRAAMAEIEAIGQRLRGAYPASNEDRVFHVETAGQINPGARRMMTLFFLMLLTVALLVLAAACANVANLLLARAAARRQEIATRLAMGASRERLIRQLLTESALLAVMGGLAGLGIAQLGIAGLLNLPLPVTLPVDLAIELDGRVMLFCFGLSVFTGVAFGLIPAWRATRPDLTGALKNERVALGASRRFALRNVLVVAQVAISMVLLVCSGLFLRSFNSARQLDAGLAHRNVLLLGFDTSLQRYAPGETRRILEAMLAGASALPGVESATISSSVPLNLEGTQNSFAPSGHTDAANRGVADHYAVAPGFFETFGIGLIAGEDFRPGEAAADIVIVNQALADKAFPQQNPVGQMIDYLGRRVRVVGLVATAKSRTIGEDPHPCLYLPLAREARGNDSGTGMTLALRTRGNPATYTAAARELIRSVDPALAVFNIRTMETQFDLALFLPRTAAFLFGLAGAMGLLIAVIGIYGVISFTVARQTKEIGVRMALGATRGQVLGMVLKEGLVLTVAGSVLGLGLALWLGRMAASLLYGVNPADPVTFVAVPALLMLVAAVACLVPARRAATLDPLRALRYE